MIQKTQKFLTKTNLEIEFRTPEVTEAANVLEVMGIIAHHSPYILSTPESFKEKTLEAQVKWIEESATNENSVILGAYHNGRLIGLSNGRSHKNVKIKHRAALGISLHPDYRGHGIGEELMRVLLGSMRLFKDVRMIELDVMTNNQVAIRMYEKLGFKKAGVLPKAYLLPNGEVSDNLTMYLEA